MERGKAILSQVQEVARCQPGLEEREGRTVNAKELRARATPPSPEAGLVEVVQQVLDHEGTYLGPAVREQMREALRKWREARHAAD